MHTHGQSWFPNSPHVPAFQTVGGSRSPTRWCSVKKYTKHGGPSWSTFWAAVDTWFCSRAACSPEDHFFLRMWLFIINEWKQQHFFFFLLYVLILNMNPCIHFLFLLLLQRKTVIHTCCFFLNQNYYSSKSLLMFHIGHWKINGLHFLSAASLLYRL